VQEFHSYFFLIQYNFTDCPRRSCYLLSQFQGFSSRGKCLSIQAYCSNITRQYYHGIVFTLCNKCLQRPWRLSIGLYREQEPWASLVDGPSTFMARVLSTLRWEWFVKQADF